LRADDGVYRIGNAAAEAHPIIGEGMSMALQSASLLCTYLLAGDHVRALTDSTWQRDVGRRYVAAWRRQFSPRLRLATAFAHLAMRPSGARLLMTAAHLWPGLLTAAARWSGKTRRPADAPVRAFATRPV
jgi:flavin-dependent dehydrogenase